MGRTTRSASSSAPFASADRSVPHAVPPLAVLRKERIAFTLVAILFGGYLAWRAAHLGLTQDEANSFWWYVLSGDFMPLRSHPDAGNHFLSSFSGWLGYTLFGPTFITLRLGSLLAYVLFAGTLIDLVGMIRTPLVRWCAFPTLLLCPFLHEYFALFRGYGPAVALFTWGLLQVVRFVQRGSARHVVQMSIAFVLAVFANLSMLPLCMTLGIAATLVHWYHGRYGKRVPHHVICFGLLVLQLTAYGIAATAALRLQDAGLLYLGSGAGLINVSVASLCRSITGQGWVVLPPLMVAMACATLAIGVWCYVRKGGLRPPLTILSGALWLEVVIRITMFNVLGVNYPEDRAAFQLLLLFLLAVPFALDVLSVTIPAFRWAALCLLPIPLITLAHMNLDNALGNGQQALPQRFAEYAKGMQDAIGRPVLITGGGQLRAAWAYAQFKDADMMQDMEHELFDEPAQDLRIVPFFLMDRGIDGYRAIDSTRQPGMYLLRRELPLDLRLIRDSTWGTPFEVRAFHGVLDLKDPSFVGQKLYIRISGTLVRGTDAGELWVMVEERSPQGRVFEDGTNLMHQKARWQGEPFDVIRRLPASPGALERYCYFWNTTDEPTYVSDLRLRLYTAED